MQGPVKACSVAGASNMTTAVTRRRVSWEDVAQKQLKSACELSAELNSVLSLSDVFIALTSK